jgi:hypothetical protein
MRLLIRHHTKDGKFLHLLIQLNKALDSWRVDET